MHSTLTPAKQVLLFDPAGETREARSAVVFFYDRVCKARGFKANNKRCSKDLKALTRFPVE